MEEYKILTFKPGTFQDRNGNTWCDVVFEGYGEPCKWVVKDPTKFKEGDSVRGEIKDWESSKGKIFPRFYRDNTPQSQPENKQDDAYWDDRNESIRAQWAIGQAVSSLEEGKFDYGTVELRAKEFYAMVDRVKGLTNPVGNEPQSGYDKAKEVRDKLAGKTTPGENQTFSNGEPLPTEAMAGDREDDDTVDLNDIPF